MSVIFFLKKCIFQIRRRRLLRMSNLDNSLSSESQANSANVSLSSPEAPGPVTSPERVLPAPQANASDVASTKMEIDDNCDSRVESMDVEEPKIAEPPLKTKSTHELVMEMISRILMVSWLDEKEQSIPIEINFDTPKYPDIISQIFTEVMFKVYQNRDFDQLIERNFKEALTESRDVPELPAFLANQQFMWFRYIRTCYMRTAIEARSNPKQCSLVDFKSVLAEIRSQCANHTLLAIEGFFGQVGPGSPFLVPLLTETMPPGFLMEIVLKTYPDFETFKKVCLINWFCLIFI